MIQVRMHASHLQMHVVVTSGISYFSCDFITVTLLLWITMQIADMQMVSGNFSDRGRSTTPRGLDPRVENHTSECLSEGSAQRMEL